MVQLITLYSGAVFEDVGVNRISAFLDERQIENEVIHIKQEEDLTEKYRKLSRAEYYGISVYGSNVADAAELGRYIKEESPNAIIFWGSQYVSLAYEELLAKYSDAVDIMVLGDGEYPILNIIESNTKEIYEITKSNPFLASQNDCTNKKPCLMNIRDLPWPKHDISIMKKHLYTTLKTSTGCAGNCAFCGFLRRKWTGYTGSQIYDELVRIRKEYNIRAFMFADNSFEDPGVVGKQRIHELLDCLESTTDEKFSFFANIRAESFSDNDFDINLLERMKRNGFSQLFVGIESGNEDDLHLYNKKATVQDNYKILEILKRVNIEAKWGFIMLNPYSTQEKLRQNYNFLISNHSYDPFHFMSFLMIYINSQLYTKTSADNLLLDSFDRMEANYKFLDPFAQAVYQFFVKKYNHTELQYRFKQFKDSLLLYFHLSQITDVSYAQEVTAIKEQLAEHNKQFFGLIYNNQDFSLAEKAFPEYTKEMINVCSKFTPVKSKILREYVSFCR